MSRAKARADRIRDEVPILDVLATYGYHVHVSGHREQQFSCDMHGDGTDLKPSARVYPESNSWFCFACGVSRDAIQTVREKENVEFREACDLLESRFKLPPLPWTDFGDDEDSRPSNLERSIETALEHPPETVADIQRRIVALLKGSTLEKSLSLRDALTLWEEYDRLSLLLENGDESAFDDMLGLRDRVVRAIRVQQAA